MSSLLCKKAVKQYALDTAAKTRHHPFTRISKDFLIRIEAATRQAIQREIQAAPSKGTTL